MRIRETYRALIPQRIRGWVRRNILTLYFEEIHIERILQTHRKLWRWIEKHPETMLMPTFSIDQPNRETMKLYEDLISSFRNPVGLHVHISGGLYHSPPPPLQDFKTQFEIVQRGLESLRSLGVSTIDFTSGNWNYNEDTFRVCRELGLFNVHIKLKEIPKITSQHGIPKGIRLIPVSRHIHDYEI